MKNIFKLLALLGIFKAGESAITDWVKPLISAAEGSETLTEKINHGMTTGDTTGITITATSNDGGGVTAYSKVSQDPSAPVLAIDNSGVVTVTSGTVDYYAASSIKIVVTADDAGETASTATVTLLVNIAPSLPASCIANGATAGTDLIDVSATDANSDTITYAIASGDTNSDFTITTAGVVEVASGKTLDMTTTSFYALVITAQDDSTTPLTATTTVTATVSTTCPSSSGAAALAVTFMTVFSALLVSLQ